MSKIIKLKIISLMTIVCFVFSSFAPYPVFAFDGGVWGESGQGVGETGVPDGPGDGEPPDQPENNPPCGGDPVLLATGEQIYECSDLNIRGRGMNLIIKHSYTSGSNDNGSFGYGWTINYYARLKTLSNGNVAIVKSGRKDIYTYTGGVYVPPPGFFETLVQNADGTWTLTKAQGEQYQFDVNGVLTAIEDRNQNRISFAYDPAGALPIIGVSNYSSGQAVIGYDYRLIRITDTVGRFVNLSYDSNGRLSTIADFAGRTLQYSYDPNTNDLLSITFPAISQYPAGIKKTFSYANHDLMSIKDARGQMFMSDHYDSNGRVDKQNLGTGYLTFNYAVANKTTVTDRQGFVTTYTFNTSGNVTRKEEFTKSIRPGDPASFITNYTYNNDMMMTSVTYPKGNGVKYVYDETNSDYRKRGNLLQVRYKTVMTAGDSDANDIVMSATYDAKFNQMKTFKDAKGNVTTYTYDYELPANHPHYGTKGNLIYLDLPAVSLGTPRWEAIYNTYGQIIEVKDPNLNITQYNYFPATGYLQAIKKDPSGINAVTQLSYDSFGYLDQVIDPNQHITDYTYNELGWLVKIKNPRGFLTKFTRDENGNVIKKERQANSAATLWQTIETTYDILNNPKTVKDPLNRITTYTYDNNENLISVLDAENHTTTYEYDERNLLFKIKDASSSQGITQYDYDTNGNIRKISDANNRATTYAFDLFDRKFTETYADGKVFKFEYDKNSNFEKLTKPSTGTNVTIQYGYDALNRLISKTYPAHTALNATYTYDLGSRLTDANTAASNNHFVYDHLNRIQTNAQTIASSIYNLQYQFDKRDNQTRVTYPSGKGIDYTYDPNNNMTFVKVGLLPISINVYDPLDRRTIPTLQQIAPTPTQSEFQYDLANQLTDIKNKTAQGDVVSEYAYPIYDQVGNRKQMQTQGAPGAQTINYDYNNIYELINVSGSQTHTYTYDKVANRQVVDGTTYVTNIVNQYTKVGSPSYTYDVDGNLTYDGQNTYSYDEENRLKSVQRTGMNAQYTYDAFNRRVSKTVNGLTTYFINDGDREVEERSSSGNLQADYVYGSGIDEVLSMTRGTNTYYYHYDGLGSVTELSKATGEVVENYTYDPYGTPSITTSAIGNPYRFTGRRFDEESNNYYYRNRTYSPTIGRFLQRDPIGYYDSMNLYQYVGNNSINWIDPYGYYAQVIGGLGAFGGFEGLAGLAGLGWVGLGIGIGMGGLWLWNEYGGGDSSSSDGDYGDDADDGDSGDNGDDGDDGKQCKPGGKEHSKGKRPSTKGKHEKGQARKQRQEGGDKKRNHSGWKPWG